MIDIGANLTNPIFTDRISLILEESIKHNLSDIIITGTSLEKSKKAEEICSKYSNESLKLYFTCGIHPHSAHEYSNKNIAGLFKEISKNSIAIGECGLDYNRMFSTKKEQQEIFLSQLSLSQELSKPLFLHCRDSYDDFFSILKSFNNTFGVVHCFTGNRQQAKQILDLGYYIGITGWITDNKRNADLLSALNYIPIDRLLIETDCPYLIPKNMPNWKKIKHSLPSHLPYIIEYVSMIKKISYDAIVDITKKNTQLLFGI